MTDRVEQLIEESRRLSDSVAYAPTETATVTRQPRTEWQTILFNFKRDKRFYVQVFVLVFLLVFVLLEIFAG